MIAVTFALPEESGEFRRALRELRPLGAAVERRFAGELAGCEIRIAHTGVGLAAAAKCAREFLEAHRPEMVISTGFAGGLDPGLRGADLVVATNLSTCALVEKSRAFLGAGTRFGTLTSQLLPAETVAQKAALAAQTGALAVDMESASIATACAEAGVPLLVARAISDPAGESLPVPFAAWFDLATQRPRVLPLLRFLAWHPTRILPFARFVRGLAPARAAMADFLVRFIAFCDLPDRRA